jgi:hypothetical protein
MPKRQSARLSWYLLACAVAASVATARADNLGLPSTTGSVKFAVVGDLGTGAELAYEVAARMATVPEYHDRRKPVHPAAVFSGILQQTPYLTTHLPSVAAYLERFPFSDAAAESSLLWSKVMMNEKPVVMVTHLGIFRPSPGPNVPAVLIARKQVYASRYMNGELTLMMLFAGPADSPSYLVNVNLSELDELGGAFGGLKAAVIERAVKKQAADTVAALRDRLERAP